MGSKQLRRMIRTIILESFDDGQMAKIKDLFTSGCASINQLDVIMEPEELENLIRDLSLAEPAWKKICDDYQHDGDIKVYNDGTWNVRGDAICERFFQRGFSFNVDPETLIIEDASCTWWQYVAYYDGDTDWEDVTPNDAYTWGDSLNGKKFTPMFACQILEEHAALHQKYPQK